MFVGSVGRRWVNCACVISLLLGLLAVPALAQYEPTPPPSAEVFGGLSYFRPNGKYLKSDPSNVSNMTGWGGSIYTPFSGNAGAVFDISGNYNSTGSWYDVMFGGEYKPRKWTLQPFGEGMMGWARRAPKHLQDQSSASFLFGGGVDLRKNARFAIRLLRLDYIHSFDNPGSTGTNQQTFWNSIRIQSGVVMTFGGPRQEEFVAAVCTATPEKVRVGEPVSAKVTPKGFAHRRGLSYEWELNQAKIGSAADAVIETASLTPGNYTIRGTASSSGKGKHQQTASCTATFAVLELPEKQSVTATEKQPSAEPAKAESQPVAESTAAKIGVQSANETPNASTAEAKPESASASTQTVAAPAAEKAVPSTVKPAESSTPAANDAVAAQDTQKSASAAAPASTEVAPAQEAPRQNLAPAERATSNSTQAALPTQPVKASSVTDATAAHDNSVEPSAKPETAAPSPSAAAETKTEPSATSGASKTAAKAKVTKHNPPTKPANAQPGTNPQPSTRTEPAVTHAVAEDQQPAAVTPTPNPVGSGEPAKTEPQVRKLNSLQFNDAKHPARLDDTGKQILREAAKVLKQSEPGSKLIIVGNARLSELQSSKDLPERRANTAKSLLTDKQNGGGVDPSSVTTYRGKAKARRVDIYLVAPGATFNPGSVAPQSKRPSVSTPELRWHGIVEK